MKIYISNYRSHWFSPYTILEFFERYIKGYDAYAKEPPRFIVEFSKGLARFLDFVHPRINYIKVDNYDTWNADYTLATIILPVLKGVKETKFSIHRIDDEDVPDEIKSMNAPRVKCEWDWDDFCENRWDYVLDEMIWTFGELIKNEDSDNISHQNRITNGLRLFGKYYRGLWG